MFKWGEGAKSVGNALAGGARLAAQALAPEEYAAARKHKHRNALANALEGGDYGAASSAAFELGDIRGGLQLAQMPAQLEEQQQAKDEAAQKQAMQRELAYLQQAASSSDPARFILDDPNFGNIIDDIDQLQFAQMIQRDPNILQNAIGQLSAQMGIAPPAPVEGKVVNDHLVDPTTGEVIGDYSDPQGPLSALGKLTADYNSGILAKDVYDAEVARATAPRTPLVQNNFNPSGAAPTLDTIQDGQVVPTELLGGYKPDTGFVALRDRSTPTGFRLEPFSGGKLERAEENRDLRQSRSGGTVVQDIGRALEIEGQEGWAGDMAVGPLAGLTKVVPGTPAHRVHQLVESALSNIGIDQLQAIRDASATGGALGQIPVQQQQRLEQMLGSLQVAQNDDDWRNNAKRAVNIYLDIIHGAGKGPERFDLEFDYLGRPLSQRPEGWTVEEWFNTDPEDRELFR